MKLGYIFDVQKRGVKQIRDYDIASQPVLADKERDGARIPVVIRATKMGLLFTFHRDTGEPFARLTQPGSGQERTNGGLPAGQKP